MPDNVILVGTIAGKGAIYRGTLVSTPPIGYGATTIGTFTTTATSADGVVSVSAPTGGMGQFKGLSYSADEAKYVQVICLGVQPMYYTSWAINLDSGASNGWVISCYTGIPQCVSSLADGVTVLDNTNASSTASCMDDPRYLTWRVMTMKIDHNATISW